MGLDTVELLITMEDEFDIEISNQEAENIATVHDYVNAIYTKIQTVSSTKCLSQVVFYRIRESFLKLGVDRNQIMPEAYLNDLLVARNLVDNWSQLENLTGLKFPKLVERDFDKSLSQEVRVLGVRVKNRPEAITNQTIRTLIGWVISLNSDRLIDLQSVTSRYELERIVCRIIHDKLGVPINEIELSHSITSDLGAD